MAARLLAQTWGTSGDFQIIEYADRVTVRGAVNAPAGVLQIPASINGKPVTAIADWAFDYSPALTGVALPSSLIEIGRGAFQGCSSLQSVSVPAGVAAIADSTFAYCSSLSSVSLPASVTSIGASAFRDCDNLASIVIAQGVTIIGNSAFADCALLKTVTFPSSLRSIGDYAFDDCASLESVVLPEGLTSIGRSAFATCSALTSAKLPSTLTSLGPYAFYQCRSLTEISIPAVTNIGDHAFAWCDALARATIAAGVGSIGEYAFHECVSLTSISIPASVTAIGKYAFYYCSGLVSATIAPGISRIPEGLFQQCSSLTTANIPEGVTSIGSYAFQDCSLLASISMPSTVTSVGNAAFRDCSGLSSVVLSAKLTSIPPNAFQSCSNLATVSIPSGVTSIGEWAFSGCRGLTEAVIPATVLSIGQWAFAYASLAKIELPDSVTSIGQHAFYECSSAQSLRLPAGLTGVANYSFSGCSSLASIAFPGTLQSIGEGAFREVAVASLAFPEGLLTIGAYAFANSGNLRSISFPASLASIGANAFSSSPLLAKAEFVGNAPSLGASAFSWAAQGFAVYYRSTATGFSSPTWQGYPAFVAVSSLAVSGTLSGFSATPGNASTAQTFTVSGSNLAANVTLSAPRGFELSVGGGSYASTATLVPTGGTLVATSVSVRLSAAAPTGSSAGDIAISSTGAASRNLAVGGTVAGVPTLELTGTLGAFSATAGTASTPQSFTVSGSSLTAVVTVTAPAGFELSADGESYGSSVSLNPAAGSLAARTISLRISAAAGVGAVSGSVAVASSGAASRQLAANGTVEAAPIPTLDVAGALTPFASTAGIASEAQRLTVAGSNLGGDVTLNAPAGFELSWGGGGYSATAQLSPSSGTLVATEISVRLAATASLGNLAGNIAIASSGASSRSVAVSGKVDSAAPPPGIFIGNFSLRPDRPEKAGDGVDTLGQLRINSSGSGFSVVAIVEGKPVRAKGTLNVAGPTSIVIASPRSKRALIIEFSRAPGQKFISAALREVTKDGTLATFACHPAAYNMTSPAPLARRRLNNLLICQEFSGANTLGRGFITAIMKPDGLLTLVGRLPDNSRVTGSVRLVSDPQDRLVAEVCLPLQPARGLLWGASIFNVSSGAKDAVLSSEPAAPLVWDRAPNPRAKFFSGGLLVFSDWHGRLWQGSAGVNALTGDSSTIAFSVSLGPDDGSHLAGSWGPSNLPVWESPGLPPKAVWKINTATGALSGRLPWTDGAVPTLFRGLLISPGVELTDGATLLGGGFSFRRGVSVDVEVAKPISNPLR